MAARTKIVRRMTPTSNSGLGSIGGFLGNCPLKCITPSRHHICESSAYATNFGVIARLSVHGVRDS